MADTIKLEIVTPYKKVLSVEVDEIAVPGAVGELGILPGHTPLLTTLKVGELNYKLDGKMHHLSINWGYLEVADDTATVLVETAELANDIDLERAKAALGRAETELTKLNSEDKEFRVMEAALERAVIRIQVAGKK